VSGEKAFGAALHDKVGLQDDFAYPARASRDGALRRFGEGRMPFDEHAVAAFGRRAQGQLHVRGMMRPNEPHDRVLVQIELALHRAETVRRRGRPQVMEAAPRASAAKAGETGSPSFRTPRRTPRFSVIVWHRFPSGSACGE